MAVTKNLVNIGDANITGNIEASSIVKRGGTASLFLKADGSVDSSTYSTTDTKNTAGSVQEPNPFTSLYIIGAPSLTEAGTQTYSNTNVTMSQGVLSALRMNATDGFFQTSDIRKKNVKEELSLEKAYDLIDKCQTIIYTLKDDESNKEQIGLIAQEVNEFFPEIVSTDKDGLMSLDYAKLTVVILRVLKDLIKRVSKLEERE